MKRPHADTHGRAEVSTSPSGGLTRSGRSGGSLQAGFGLLEALVALVLFSTLGLALFSWINTNLDATARLRQRDQVRHLEQLASAWVQTLNPLQRPEGEIEPEAGIKLRWTARPLVPLTGAAPLPGGSVSLFRLRLYTVEMLVAAPGQAPLKLSATRIGSERDAAQTPAAQR